MLALRTPEDLATVDDRVRVAGEAANAAATAYAFADYTSRKAANTLTAQRADLRLFSEYLAEAVGAVRTPEDLQAEAAAWLGVTWGIVAAFVPWLLARGLAHSSISRALTTVKTYARLAHKAGAIDSDNALRIRSVLAYSGKEAKRVDEARAQAGTPTRKGHKKGEATRITDDQAKALKGQPDTPQGRRDALLMALLLDHGLRESELEHVTMSAIDLAAGTFTFYRPKVDKVQTHKLSTATLRALRAWVDNGHAPDAGPILRGSRKGGELLDTPMSLSAIRQRVRALGEAAGVAGLSPHDCRHYWATRWAGKVDLLRLQEAGGWSSLEMPRRYVAWAAIANEGMND